MALRARITLAVILRMTLAMAAVKLKQTKYLRSLRWKLAA